MKFTSELSISRPNRVKFTTFFFVVQSCKHNARPDTRKLEKAPFCKYICTNLDLTSKRRTYSNIRVKYFYTPIESL